MLGLDLEHTLERWRAAAKWAIARLLYRAVRNWAVAALEIDGATLGAAAIPHLFSTDLREIDPTLNDDLLDLYGRSNQILENRFAFLNRSRRFESEMDWEPNESLAWRKELHAFDYILDLALTCRISCEERYAGHLRYLIALWIASNPPVGGTGWLPDVVARRVRNWILAADLARQDWERDPEFLSVVSHSLAQQITFLNRHASVLRTPAEILDASRALLIASRLFSGRQASELRSAGFLLLSRELERRADAASPIEPWPTALLHLATTLMEWLLFDEEGRDAESLKEELRQTLSSLEAWLLPGGTLPLMGPAARAGKDELENLAGLAAVQLNSAQWKSLAGKLGILPYMILGEAGKAKFNRLADTAWKAGDCFRPQDGVYRLSGADRSALVVNGRRPPVPGGHQDSLSYELSIQGQPVVVDSGGFGAEGDPYFSSGKAHNLLLIDGQAPRWSKRDVASLPQDAWESRPGFVRLKLPDPGFEFRGLRHQRAWFCLEGRLWVILDRLEGRGTHRCVSLLHVYPTLEIELRGPTAMAGSRACSVTLIPLGEPPARMTASCGEHTEFPGWYSPQFGIKYTAGVLAIEWREAILPWVGGVLIVPGAGEAIGAQRVDASPGEISFDLAGKTYRLHLP